jgi:hypothetical protein
MDSMRNKRLIGQISLLFALGAYCEGAVYYLSNSGFPACSNSTSAGTLAQPFCSFDYGVSRLAPGDTLYVRAGTYSSANGGFSSNGWVGMIGHVATAAHPTLISAYPGDAMPVLIGAGYSGGRILFRNSSYITLTGFEIKTIQQGVELDGSDHITISHNKLHDVGIQGILIHLCASDSTQCACYNGGNGGVCTSSSYVTVDNNQIFDTGHYGYDGEGIYIGASTSVSDADNTNNVTVIHNTIHDIRDECVELKPGTHDNTVDGNVIYNCNNVPYSTQQYGGAAIEVSEAVASPQHWNFNPNQIVRNNIIHASGMAGDPAYIQTGIRAGTGGLYYNNVVYGIIGTGNGILASNGMFGSPDSYMRKIYHNTIDIPSSRAIVTSGNPTVDIRNNIGPISSYNVASNSAFYVNEASADYHLVTGVAPINAGYDLTSIVGSDIEGYSRLTSPPPDFGAYEFHSSSGSPPAAPTGLTAIVQ